MGFITKNGKRVFVDNAYIPTFNYDESVKHHVTNEGFSHKDAKHFALKEKQLFNQTKGMGDTTKITFAVRALALKSKPSQKRLVIRQLQIMGIPNSKIKHLQEMQARKK